VDSFNTKQLPEDSQAQSAYDLEIDRPYTMSTQANRPDIQSA
jgi:hypothetical protein